MLAKLTSKNQITIPKKIIDEIPDVRYFDVELKEDDIEDSDSNQYQTTCEFYLGLCFDIHVPANRKFLRFIQRLAERDQAHDH